jgi:hypothetical protein
MEILEYIYLLSIKLVLFQHNSISNNFDIYFNVFKLKSCLSNTDPVDIFLKYLIVKYTKLFFRLSICVFI